MLTLQPDLNAARAVILANWPAPMMPIVGAERRTGLTSSSEEDFREDEISAGIKFLRPGEIDWDPDDDVEGEGDRERGSEVKSRVGLRQGDANSGRGGDVGGTGGESAKNSGTADAQTGPLGQLDADQAVDQRHDKREAREERTGRF